MDDPCLSWDEPLSFTLWHLPCAQDWTVHTAICGVPEVIARERWASWSRLALAGIRAGFTSEQANLVSHTIARADVLTYADIVHNTIHNWLSTLVGGDLDVVPDMESHMDSYAAYQHPGFRTEIEYLIGKPIWRLLVSPCIGHLRDHLGGLGRLKQALCGSLRQV